MNAITIGSLIIGGLVLASIVYVYWQRNIGSRSSETTSTNSVGFNETTVTETGMYDVDNEHHNNYETDESATESEENRFDSDNDNGVGVDPDGVLDDENNTGEPNTSDSSDTDSSTTNTSSSTSTSGGTGGYDGGMGGGVE